MILFNGKIFSDDRLDSILARLPEHCTCTLENRIPLYQAVIHACSTLSEQIQRGTYHSIMGKVNSKCEKIIKNFIEAP